MKTNICPECKCERGHKIDCKTGNDKARAYQSTLGRKPSRIKSDIKLTESQKLALYAIHKSGNHGVICERTHWPVARLLGLNFIRLEAGRGYITKQGTAFITP